ncbi:hypothetical protein [Pseudomonas vanderleydeniana]|uniref:Uncharacterized protein n=1 Tax=Pseudomonas vanderleydeniana TaxID=2745495 RepID=A0A9E6PMM0_9PSED|nr:hypothetical protein [Pseudomonas vanderleydeniana]QXI28853.1 hypothetical protein HU752_002505 [Pseudomonas vanderleydeniana]
MPKFKPLQSNLCQTPVFYYDADAPLTDLHECATQRCNAARDLMYSITCLGFSQIDDKDLRHFSTAAWLLLQDGCDVLAAIGWKMERAASH